MSKGFASASLTAGQLNAIVKKLGGVTNALRFLRGELTVSVSPRPWREEDGIIYFTVTSDGASGEQWISRLVSKGFNVGYYARQVLRSQHFTPTNRVTTEVVVLKGMLFEHNDRSTKKIRAEADKRKLSTPNAELACLIREKFTDKELDAMGLRFILVMHEAVDLQVASFFLDVTSDGDGRLLNGCDLYSDDEKFGSDYGFAFDASEVSSRH